MGNTGVQTTFRLRAVLVISLLLNAVLLGLGLWALQRLGGVSAAWGRLQQHHAALYEHRKTLFEQLPARPGAVVFVGDSQTEQAEWHELMSDTLPLLNRGISADYVIGVRERLDEVLRHQPAAVYLQVGINDLLFGKTPEEIAAVYREILVRLQQAQPAPRLVVQSVFPLQTDLRDFSTDNTRVRELNALLRQLAAEHRAQYADVYTALCDARGQLDARYTSDGIHLNGRGYLVWKNTLEQLPR